MSSKSLSQAPAAHPTELHSHLEAEETKLETAPPVGSQFSYIHSGEAHELDSSRILADNNYTLSPPQPNQKIDYEHLQRMHLAKAQQQLKSSKQHREYSRTNAVQAASTSGVKEKAKHKKKGTKLILQDNLMHSLDPNHSGLNLQSNYQLKMPKSKNLASQRAQVHNAIVVNSNPSQNQSPTKRRKKTSANATSFSQQQQLQLEQSYLPQGHSEVEYVKQPAGALITRGRIVTDIMSLQSANALALMNTQKVNPISDSEAIPESKSANFTQAQSKRHSHVAPSASGAPMFGHQRKGTTGQTQQSQTFAYAAQIKEAAEKGAFGNSHAKSSVRQPKQARNNWPIDTFNIVKSRRKSLVKQISEAAQEANQVELSSTMSKAQTQQIESRENPTAQQLILPEISSNSKSNMNYYHQPTDASKTLSQGTSKMMRMSSKDVTKPHDTSMSNNPKNASQYNSNYQSINQSMDVAHQESIEVKRQATGSITSPQAPLLQSITPNQQQNISMIQPQNQVRSRIKKIISPIQGGPASGQPDGKTLMMSQRQDLEEEEVFVEHPKSQIQGTAKQPRPKIKRGESHDQNFIAFSQMKSDDPNTTGKKGDVQLQKEALKKMHFIPASPGPNSQPFFEEPFKDIHQSVVEQPQQDESLSEDEDDEMVESDEESDDDNNANLASMKSLPNAQHMSATEIEQKGIEDKAANTNYLYYRQAQRPQQQKKEKKKKKHRRQNTHHHYHIDFNFEQVNNILVSYGGVGLHQQIKNQIKKDSSKANVSLSLGIVHGNTTRHNQGVSGSMGPTPASSSKRGHPGILLPELIINKNKVNIGNKSFKLNVDEKTKPHQVYDSAAKQIAASDQKGLKEKPKKRKTKKDQATAADDYLAMASRKIADKYKTPKKHKISQSLNPSMEGMLHGEARYTKGPEQIQILKQNQVTMVNPTELKKLIEDSQKADFRAKRPSNHSHTSKPVSPDVNRPFASQISDHTSQHNPNGNISSMTGNDYHPYPMRTGEWQSAHKPQETGEVAMTPQVNESFAATRYDNNIQSPRSSTSRNRNSLQQRKKHELNVITEKQNSLNQADKARRQHAATKHMHSPTKIKMQFEDPGPKSASLYNDQTETKEVRRPEYKAPGISSARSNKREAQHTQQSTINSGDPSKRSVKTGMIAPSSTSKLPSKFKSGSHRLRNDELTKSSKRMPKDMNSSFKLHEMSPAVDSQGELVTTNSPSLLKEKAAYLEKKNKPKITDFEIKQVIGIGNFGKVYQAYNTKDHRQCALKVLKKESVAQMKHVNHIINEREVLQYLTDKRKQSREESHLYSSQPLDPASEDCPFIMDIYSSFQDKENLYFELEYIQGCTMLSQIRSCNEQVRQNMYFYAAEVIFSLGFLHANNIIYRDLKPENIVLSMTERGHIKLVDFGFAKRVKNLSQRTYTNCGTPAYIAPEVLRGHNGHGYEADIWSLGVLMFELSSGTTPFTAESTQGVYEKINKCEPQFNKFINPTLRDLLSKIFVPDPEIRISLEEMKDHPVFKDFDWSIPMHHRFEYSAPFVPDEAMFNEQADRTSETMKPNKPANLLAAIMGNPQQNDGASPEKKLTFDEAHYNKFEREAAGVESRTQNDETATRRKRQNPLGDFKFKRINELF